MNAVITAMLNGKHAKMIRYVDITALPVSQTSAILFLIPIACKEERRLR